MSNIWLEPVNFSQVTTMATGEGYLSLPVYKDDRQFISCWKASFWQRVKFLFSGKIYLCLEHCNQPTEMKKLYDGKNYHQPSSCILSLRPARLLDWLRNCLLPLGHNQ